MPQWLLIGMVLALAGCSRPQPYNLLHLAPQHGFRVDTIKAPPFTLTVAIRHTNPERPLHVYIEGDGRAYITKYLPANNPTPTQPIAFRLAQLDDHPNVVYLARPCQYTLQDKACDDNKWWTSHRFAPAAVAATNQALDQLKSTPDQPLRLVGFSGGATHALLAAAQRNDVEAIITVAGNVAPHTVNRHHGVTPTPAAISPIAKTRTLSEIPQQHLVGAQDDIIPKTIVQKYAAALQHQRCVNITVFPQARHTKGWAKIWPQPLENGWPQC